MTIKGIIGDSNHSLSTFEEKALKIRGIEDGQVYCQRFQGNDLKSDLFQKEMLQKIE